MKLVEDEVDEASWLRNTELHPQWAAPSDLRHLGLKRYPL